MVFRALIALDDFPCPFKEVDQGTTTIREGTWTIARGTDSDRDAIIYQLHLDRSQQPVSFLKADENLLYLLDRALSFLVGDAVFSNTLSRTAASAQ
jgi:hypothetical protein